MTNMADAIFYIVRIYPVQVYALYYALIGIKL